MQYLVSVIHDKPDLATPAEMAAIDAFNDRLQAEGYWVFAGGLGSPSTATVIDNRGGEAVFTDGPFLESKEYLAGFWIIEAADLDVALKLAAEGSKACNRKVEVQRNAAKAAGRAYDQRKCPAIASTSRIVHHRRSRKALKEIREAVSDRGRGVRSRGERPPTRGAPNHRR